MAHLCFEHIIPAVTLVQQAPFMIDEYTIWLYYQRESKQRRFDLM